MYTSFLHPFKTFCCIEYLICVCSWCGDLQRVQEYYSEAEHDMAIGNPQLLIANFQVVYLQTRPSAAVPFPVFVPDQLELILIELDAATDQYKAPVHTHTPSALSATLSPPSSADRMRVCNVCWQ
jgi:hypothetical protein